MNHQSFVSLLRRVLSTPTAPFHEYHVAALVREILEPLPHVTVQEDAVGNLIATYRRGRKKPRYAFGAHMDHPGWVRHRGREEFLGGVPESRLQSHEVEWWGEFGMWDLQPFELREGMVHARVCDDLVGCASILAMLIDLEKSEVEATCHGIFTRAEEVGLVGAVHLAKAWPFPPSVRFISLETSAPRGSVEMGQGVVVRVGDRMSVFDDVVTSELIDAAGEASIPFQRALLDGGSCEATAMNLYGHSAAGLSVLLGNYHNCPPDSGIAEEFVSLADVKSMQKLITALVVRSASSGRPAQAKQQMKQRLEARVRQHQAYFKSSAPLWRQLSGETRRER